MRGDRGSATAELAVVGPVLMMLILGALQFGLWYHARHVVQTAAVEGARRAAAEGASLAEAKAHAMSVLRAGLGEAARGPAARASLEQEDVRVRVEANMKGLLPLPGLSSFALDAEARAHREAFRPRGRTP